MLGFSGYSFFIYGLGNHGDSASKSVGDAQITSNIEAPSTFKIYEIHIQKNFNENLSMLLGTRDLNADFYATESSKIFLNSTFGVGKELSQTGANGPSIFPTTSAALTMKYHQSGFYAVVGAFNAQAGNPNMPYGTQITNNSDAGTLSIGEVGFENGTEALGTSKYSLGTWSYSKKATAIDTTQNDSLNQGHYFLFDQILTPRKTAFLRYGTASEKVNSFASSLSAGIKCVAPFSSRPDDIIAVGIAKAQTSTAYRKSSADISAEESTLELSYQFHVTNGLSIQPDLQFVTAPSASKSIKNAQVFSTRFEFEF